MEELFKALDISSEKLAELMEAYHADVEAKASLKADTIIAEAKVKLDEEYTEMFDGACDALASDLDEYLDIEVEKIVEGHSEDLKVAVDSAKYGAVLEAFEAMVVASGVEIADIESGFEQKLDEDENEAGEKIAELEDRLNVQVQETIDLKAKNLELEKSKIVAEACEDLSAVKVSKIEEAVKVMNSDDIEQFGAQVQALVEAVSGSDVEKQLDESVKKVEKSAKVDYSRYL